MVRRTTRRSFKPRPWKIKIDGDVAKPGDYDIDEFIKPYMLEERIYRMRCVEAWSFVVPWIGIPMAEVIKRVEPTLEGEVPRDDHADGHGPLPDAAHGFAAVARTSRGCVWMKHKTR